jgi:ParB/RepB/Spo0J family partition protein
MSYEEYQRVEWEVTKLKPHPKQEVYFSAPVQSEIEELAADLKKNGQQMPIDVLPDGTILCGHKRLAAAQFLGWKEVKVVVRNDLANDPEEAERRLIEDNLNRRQLSQIAIARCYRNLQLLSRTGKNGRIKDQERGDLRDQIGKRLGKSGRHLDRLLRILELTPVEVQNAYDAGKLSLADALRVADQTMEVKDKIATGIKNGGDPGKVIRSFVPVVAKHKRVESAFESFLKGLQFSVPDLEGRTDEIECLWPTQVKILDRTEKLIQELKKLPVRRESETSVEEQLAALGCKPNALADVSVTEETSP